MYIICNDDKDKYVALRQGKPFWTSKYAEAYSWEVKTKAQNFVENNFSRESNLIISEVENDPKLIDFREVSKEKLEAVLRYCDRRQQDLLHDIEFKDYDMDIYMQLKKLRVKRREIKNSLETVCKKNKKKESRSYGHRTTKEEINFYGF